MNTEPATLHGGCQCGSVRYQCTQPAMKTYVCHCTECRKQSSSAFGISVQVSQVAFRVVRGEPKLWSRPTETGHVLDCWFCPDCGSRLWHQRHGSTETLNIKGGSLDAPVDLGGAVHIWTRSALPGVAIPQDAVRFPREPG